MKGIPGSHAGNRKMKSDGTLPTEVPDSMVPPLCDAQYLVDRIAEVTRRPVEEVAARLMKEHDQIGRNVREALESRKIQTNVWSDQMVDFYNDTDAFFYETTIWNRSLAKNRMRDWIGRFLQQRRLQSTRLLIYGDGLGFDSFYLTQAGHQVEYFDLSSDSSQFARQIFRDYGQELHILYDASDVAHEAYDVVVCLDVLEHVPVPSETISFLASALRPGGVFLVHAPFWYVDPSVGTHLRSNQEYSGDWRRLYAPHGLQVCDGGLFWNPLALQKTGMEPQNPVARSHGFRVWLGGWLLSWGRFWSWPHRQAWKMVYSRQWREWGDLREINGKWE